MSSQIAGSNKFRARRTHRKSRLGCGNCKKRRVKCDEIKPTCTNCSQHSIECDFSTSVVSTPGSIRSAKPIDRVYRFKASQYQPYVSSPSPEESLQNARMRPTTATGTQCNLLGGPTPTGISLPDLRLFHNFVTSTYRSLVSEPEGYDLWQNHIPQWAIEYPSILHLILSLSALHLCRQHPELRSQYLARAVEQFDAGVRSSAAMVSKMTADNCQPVYISAVLICFAYFAKGPKLDEYLIFSEKGPAEWLMLMRGVRAILHSEHDKIFSGVLEPKCGPVSQVISSELIEEWLEHQDHIRSLQTCALRAIRERSDCEMYESAFCTLTDTVEEVYKMRSTQKDGVALMHIVIGWLYRLPERFVTRLEQKETFALMVLAHWAVLLKYMRPAWFMESWDKHVIEGIHKYLPEGYRGWLDWPTSQIQRSYP